MSGGQNVRKRKLVLNLNSTGEVFLKTMLSETETLQRYDLSYLREILHSHERLFPDEDHTDQFFFCRRVIGMIKLIYNHVNDGPFIVTLMTQ